MTDQTKLEGDYFLKSCNNLVPLIKMANDRPNQTGRIKLNLKLQARRVTSETTVFVKISCKYRSSNYLRVIVEIYKLFKDIKVKIIEAHL